MSFSSTANNAHNSNNNDDNMANSSLDFVSADVNEMPQDARQILTNREQRRDGQHPNELDESTTTVQVTKQSGDEDPMELTVLRKRLVKGEEAETEDPGNEEDDVQLKVEIAEQCQQQKGKGTHFVEQMIAVIMSFAAIVVSLCDKFYDKLYRPLRAGIFSCIELRTKMEEKDKEIAEKDKQIDALLMQLNESTSHQHPMPTEHQMKIQLSLETWYDWLAFVPRHQLGQIVSKIGDRRFASIIQKFLHEYRESTLKYCIDIVAPNEEDPKGHPRVRVYHNNRPLRFKMAKAQMPANITNFNNLQLSYFDKSVLHFLQKFQQNGLLDNVNLSFSCLLSKDKIQSVLRYILPMINGITAIGVEDSAQLVDFYDAANSKEIYELNMRMMEKTRLLDVSFDDCTNLHANKIDLYCRWLYQTARADGKPRVLILFYIMDANNSPICLFIDRLIQDFLMATDPVTFFIRIILPDNFQLKEDICLDNGKTKERLLTRTEVINVQGWVQDVLLISRYPLVSTKTWTVENEKEVLDWDFVSEKNRTIRLDEDLKVVAL